MSGSGEPPDKEASEGEISGHSGGQPEVKEFPSLTERPQTGEVDKRGNESNQPSSGANQKEQALGGNVPGQNQEQSQVAGTSQQSQPKGGKTPGKVQQGQPQFEQIPTPQQEQTRQKGTPPSGHKRTPFWKNQGNPFQEYLGDLTLPMEDQVALSPLEEDKLGKLVDLIKSGPPVPDRYKSFQNSRLNQALDSIKAQKQVAKDADEALKRLNLQGGEDPKDKEVPMEKDPSESQGSESSEDGSDSSTESGEHMSVDANYTYQDAAKPSKETFEFERALKIEKAHMKLLKGINRGYVKQQHNAGNALLSPVDLMFMKHGKGQKDKAQILSTVYKLDLTYNPKINKQFQHPRIAEPERKTEVFLLIDVYRFLKGRLTMLHRIPDEQKSESDIAERKWAMNAVSVLPEYIQLTKKHNSLPMAERRPFFDGKKASGGSKFRNLWTAVSLKEHLYFIQKHRRIRLTDSNYDFQRSDVAEAYSLGGETPLEMRQVQSMASLDSSILEYEQGAESFQTHIQNTSSVGKIPERYKGNQVSEAWPNSFYRECKRLEGSSDAFGVFDEKLVQVSDLSGPEYPCFLYIIQRHFCMDPHKLAYQITTTREKLPEKETHIGIKIGHPEPIGYVPPAEEPQRTVEQNVHTRLGPRNMGYSLDGYMLLRKDRPSPPTLGAFRSYVFWTNMMYLRKTNFENPPDNLESEEAKKLVQRVNVLTDMITALHNRQKVTFTEQLTDSQRDPTLAQHFDANKKQREEEDLVDLFSNEKISDEVYNKRFDEIQQKYSGLPKEPQMYELESLLERISLTEKGVLDLDLQPLNPVSEDGLLPEKYRAFHVLLLAAIEYYHSKWTGGMEAMEKLILEETLLARPNAPLSDALQQFHRTKSIIRTDTWFVAFRRNDTKRKIFGGMFYTFLYEFSQEQYPEGQEEDLDIRQLTDVLKEIIVAGMRGIRTHTTTPEDALQRQEDKKAQEETPAPQDTKPAMQYYGPLVDPAFDPRAGFGRRPRGLPLIMNHVGQPKPVPLKEMVSYDTPEAQGNHPTVDIFSTAENKAYQTPVKIADNRGSTAFGWKHQQRFIVKPESGPLYDGIASRLEHNLFDNKVPMSEPMFEMENVCTGGYIQYNPEPDYDCWQTYHGQRNEFRSLTKYADSIVNYVTRHNVTILTLFQPQWQNQRHHIQPVMDPGFIHAWCTQNALGKWNMPGYMNPNLTETLAYHTRVLTVTDGMSGALFGTSVIFCCNAEVCALTVRNLIEHLYKTPLMVWQIMILPAKPEKTQQLKFPVVLNQLPPALYEYIIGESSPLGRTSVLDLYRVQKDPYKHFKSSSPVLGFQGALTKMQILYGVPLSVIVKSPRFLLQYMECYIMDGIYLYDRNSKQLQSPWTLFEPQHRLRQVLKVDDSSMEESYMTPMGVNVREAEFLAEWQDMTGYVLGGSLTAAKQIKESPDQVPQIVKEDLEILHKTLRDIVGLYYIENIPLGTVTEGSLYPMPPEMLYLQNVAVERYYQQQAGNSGHTIKITWSKKSRQVVFPCTSRPLSTSLDQSRQYRQKKFNLGFPSFNRQGSKFSQNDAELRLWQEVSQSQPCQEAGAYSGNIVPTGMRDNPLMDIPTWRNRKVLSYWDIFGGVNLKWLDTQLFYPVYLYIVQQKDDRKRKHGDQPPDRGDDPSPGGGAQQKPPTGEGPNKKSKPDEQRPQGGTSQRPKPQQQTHSFVQAVNQQLRDPPRGQHEGRQGQQGGRGRIPKQNTSEDQIRKMENAPY